VIFSTLLGKPSAPADGEPGGAEPRRPETLSLTRRRARRYRIAISSGLIASVLLHILMVRLSPLLIRYLEADVGMYQIPPPIFVEPQGMRAIEVRIVETPTVETEPAPEPVPEVIEPEEEEGEAEPSLSGAERLRPRVGDWRLWVFTRPSSRTDLTPEERSRMLEERIYAMLEAYDDSIAAELARQAEAMDWSVGEEGNKWGVSPGKIHLGPITLPLPIYIGPGRESEDMLRDYGAIQRQAGEAAVRDAQKDRIKAIREREQKAREEAQKKEKNDTTGTGGP
jgi:hypothetical protein